jgi:hypothetical protein
MEGVVGRAESLLGKERQPEADPFDFDQTLDTSKYCIG